MSWICDAFSAALDPRKNFQPASNIPQTSTTFSFVIQKLNAKGEMIF